MTRPIEDVIEEVLQMSEGDRATLAETLLDSLRTPQEQEIALAWAKEAERRYDDLKSGRVQGLTLEEFFSDED